MESFTCLKEVRVRDFLQLEDLYRQFRRGLSHPLDPSRAQRQAIDFSRFETYRCDNVVVMKAPQREGSIYGGVWLWAYPNMTLSVYPDGMNTSRILPVDRQTSRLIYHFYFRDTAPEGAAAREADHRDQLPASCARISASARSPSAISRPAPSAAGP